MKKLMKTKNIIPPPAAAERAPSEPVETLLTLPAFLHGEKSAFAA